MAANKNFIVRYLCDFSGELQICFKGDIARHMKFIALSTLAILFLATTHTAPAMSKKPKVTVRFHTEANPRDSGSFAMPVRLAYAQRDAVLSRVPELSERQVVSIFPFKTADDSWGCTFKFNEQGRIRLETMSNQQRGSALVVFVATKAGQHQVVDMVVDQPVTTGMITVPRGLTDMEIQVMRQQFKIMGQNKKEKPSKKKDEGVPGEINRERDARENDSRKRAGHPPAAEADVPRFED